jgi:hypothetical protein
MRELVQHLAACITPKSPLLVLHKPLAHHPRLHKQNRLLARCTVVLTVLSAVGLLTSMHSWSLATLRSSWRKVSFQSPLQQLVVVFDV